MQIQGIGTAGNVSGVYQSLAASQNYRANSAAPTASFADVVSISPAARERLAAESKSSASGSFDTDKGNVELDLDAYFTSKPANPNAELPPLLMPSQRNIDALVQHINQKFPAFLSANGIPSAPANIQYNANGEAQFPADYPYAAQLKQALKENPGMERELSTVKALDEFKNLLNESAPFQQQYAAANSPDEIKAVNAKYSYLLSGNSRSDSSALFFDSQGKISIGKLART